MFDNEGLSDGHGLPPWPIDEDTHSTLIPGRWTVDVNCRVTGAATFESDASAKVAPPARGIAIAYPPHQAHATAENRSASIHPAHAGGSSRGQASCRDRLAVPARGEIIRLARENELLGTFAFRAT